MTRHILYLIRALIIVAFLILFVRLFELQVIKGGYYKDLADGNRIRRVVIKAPRGDILARGGEVLSKNSDLEKWLFFNYEKGYYVETDSPDKKLTKINSWIRKYPLRDSASHITGYVGLVNTDEAGKTDAQCINKGMRSADDTIGRSGLEEFYDCRLRGDDGEMLIEVEADGSFIRELGTKEPEKGEDIKTTIDYPLQEYVSTLFDGVTGAIIASDPTGQILAMYSSPSYDPNLFVEGSEKTIEILNDDKLPLFNRSISGKYPPGSIYKPLVATAALETKVIDRGYHYQDTGSITFSTAYGNYSFSNWYFTQYGGSEGSIDVTRAIARSTDTFFYKIGELTGIDNIVSWSQKFGLSQKTGIDLSGEVEGLVPSPKWKEEVKGERWFLGNTYHLSIGQGDLLVTPIAIHSAISAISNGGELCKPHFVSGFETGYNPNCLDLGIEESNIELVKEGMRKACSAGGTGYTFFDFEEKSGVEVACKTGTAQVGTEDKTHAWFTVFGPVDEPEIVLTILVEEGGEGSKVAGPIARQVFDFWYKDRVQDTNEHE